jgi:DNA polymerase-3 subunit gamma/tau
MSYQVLARKWRPKNFKELMGQDHVVTVLVNALEQQRLHHAYLFTGTRGVGKTTIARIFAKSLNCQVGITSEPCGKCDTCLDIDLGRFVDLIEIDAASKTKVDDTREILDNVQYAPTSGRYKVYLIDEVHMLSRSSFNALLKTLEEPPEHVKFILATTDPQKLPVTVLSRCLQFHLKALTVSQIEQQLNIILNAENVKADKGSVTLLAKAAHGSMRDSLSLTDQSIAQGSGEITISNVQKMLGGVDQNWVYKILINLIKQDSKQLMELSLNIANYSPSYSRLLAELIQLLHQVAMVQIVDRHFDLSPEHEALLNKFSKAMSPEDVQLYYQIVLNARKDLPYACDEQAAFDMLLLRLLAFKPVVNTNELPQEGNYEHLVSNNLVESTDFNDVPLVDSIEKEVATTYKEEGVVREELAIEHVVEKGIESNPVHSSKEEMSMTDEQVQSQLAAEMNNIEQDAAQQLPHQQPFVSEIQTEAPSLIEPQKNESSLNQDHSQAIATEQYQTNFQSEDIVKSQAEPITYSSPVESAIATRNILRSRKKEMEQNGKKLSDAAGRQIQTTDNTVNADTNTLDRNSVDSNTVIKPEVPSIEMVTNEPYREGLIDPSKIKLANQVDKWANMIDSMALSARIRQIAIHATISDLSTDNHLILLLDQSTKHLKTDVAVEQLQQSISNYLSQPVMVEINLVEETKADPYKIQVDINDKRYQYAVNLLKDDEVIKGLQEHFQAKLDESTIQAL